MRFITKLSFVAILAVAVVSADEARVSPAGEELLLDIEGDSEQNEVFGSYVQSGNKYDDEYDLYRSGGDDLEGDFDDFEYGRRRHHHRHHHRCGKCGHRPCRCHRRTERSEESGEVVEEPNNGRLIITAPQCGQNFSLQSWQSICWSGPTLQAAGFDSFLGYYVGGKSCLKNDKYESREEREIAANAISQCPEGISDRNVLYLGCSNVPDGGYLPFNIPFCISEGYYQALLFAFKKEGKKTKYIVAKGPNVRLIRNQGQKIESNLKRVN